MAQLASPWRTPVTSVSDAPFIAADVGGTHARVGLVRSARGGDGRVAILAYRKYVCADHADLAAILRHFIDTEVGAPVEHCALACAGIPIDGVVINDNLPWTVSVPALREALGFVDLSLVNDFEAVAHATRFIDVASTSLLAGPATGEGPVIVVGPGTGLGSAVCIPGTPTGIVLPTEAGQINLAPTCAREREVLARLAGQNNYVSHEHVLSGPGLVTLYRVLSQLHGTPAGLDAPEAITGAALRGESPAATETLDMFCALLGSFVGNLAMLYSASGGVYLAGGILPRMRGFLERSRFVDRFLDKGRMRAFLERIPVRLMEHGQLGVIGAAGWYLGQRDGT